MDSFLEGSSSVVNACASPCAIAGDMNERGSYSEIFKDQVEAVLF